MRMDAADEVPHTGEGVGPAKTLQQPRSVEDWNTLQGWPWRAAGEAAGERLHSADLPFQGESKRTVRAGIQRKKKCDHDLG